MQKIAVCPNEEAHEELPLEVLATDKSEPHYYIGRSCPNCGYRSTESWYFQTSEQAHAYLQWVQDRQLFPVRDEAIKAILTIANRPRFVDGVDVRVHLIPDAARSVIDVKMYNTFMEIWDESHR